MISSGFSFCPPFWRFVTALSLRVFFSPFGLSIMSFSQPLLARDCSSSQRVVTASPCFRKACGQQHSSHFKGTKKVRICSFPNLSKLNFSISEGLTYITSPKLNLRLYVFTDSPFILFSLYIKRDISQYWSSNQFWSLEKLAEMT